MINKKLDGFTLIELLIVIVIIAVLASIAYPSYVDQVNNVRRTGAQTALVELAARLQEFYVDGTPPTYEGASLTGEDAIFPSEAPLEGSDKYYNLSIATQNARTFTITAAPISTGPMEGDFTFSLDSQGNKSHYTGTTAPTGPPNGWP